MVLQACVILAYPFFIFTYSTSRFKSMMLVLYERNTPNSYLAFQSVVLGSISLGLLEYLVYMLSQWMQIRKRDRSLKTYEDEKEVLTTSKKHLLNFMILQFSFNSLVLAIPARTFAIRALIIVQSDNGVLNINQKTQMTVLAIMTLLAEFASTSLYHFCIQCVFPLEKQIPWCQISPRTQFIQEGISYLFCIAVAIPQASSYVMYIYAIFTVLSLISLVYTKTYFDPVVMKVSNFLQACVIMTMLVMTCGINRPTSLSTFFIIMILILLAIVSLIIQMVEQHRKHSTFLQTEKLQKSKSAYRWIWSIYQHYYFKQDADVKGDRLRQVLIGIQNQIKRHQLVCGDEGCICAKPKLKKLMKIKTPELCTEENVIQLKLYLIEIYLSKLFGKSDQELDSQQKNDIIGLLLVFKWQAHKRNYLCCIYNLLKYHDCSSCTIHECQQFFFLRKLIFKKLIEKQQTDEGTVRFQKMIYFEQSFKSLTHSINSTTQAANQFWSQISKGQIDLDKSNQHSEKIILAYHKYAQIYKKVKEECGDIMIVEQLAWRLHQEVLQFDVEAVSNVETLKNILNKQRLHRKAQDLDDSSNLQYNFRNYFVIVSANPQYFQNILGVSKQLMKLVGYTEEFLLTNKLPVLLPKVVDGMHERLLKSYLRKKTSNLQKITLKKQWLLRNDGAVMPVSINIIPKYDIVEGLRLVGIVHCLKKLPLFDAEYSLDQVFTVLGDINSKITHVSENCVTHLQFKASIHQDDLLLHQLFLQQPENLQNGQEFFSQLDLTPMLQNSIEGNEGSEARMYYARVQFSEKVFSPFQVLKEFNFIVISQSIRSFEGLSPDEARASLQSLALFDFGNGNPAFFSTLQAHHLTNDTQGERSQVQTKASKVLIIGANGVEDPSENTDNQFMELSSMSSNSSGSSNFSNQDAQIGEIKQTIEFNSLPRSLKLYRAKLITGFLAILATAITLLIVNVYSSNNFQSNLSALYSEKRIRNNFSSSRLIALLIYTSANTPSSIDMSDFGIDEFRSQITMTDYLILNMKDVLEVFQEAMTTFAQQQTSWDKQFAELFSGQRLNLTYLTTTGNVLNQSQTFQKAMTLIQADASFFQNSKRTDFVASNFNVFATNSLSQIQSVVKSSSTPAIMKSALSCLYNLVENGSNELLTQMLAIDDAFLSQVLSISGDVERVLLIATICCCVLVLILSSFFVPYLWAVEAIHRQMMEFVMRTKPEVVETIVDNCKDFSEYIERNKYLQSQEEGNQKESRGTYQSTFEIGLGDKPESKMQQDQKKRIQSKFGQGATAMSKRFQGSIKRQIKNEQRDNFSMFREDEEEHKQHARGFKQSQKTQHLGGGYQTTTQGLMKFTTTQGTQPNHMTTTFQTQDRLESNPEDARARKLFGAERGIRVEDIELMDEEEKQDSSMLALNQHGPSIVGGKNPKHKFLKKIMDEEGADELDLKKELRKQNRLGHDSQKSKSGASDKRTLDQIKMHRSDSKKSELDGSDEEDSKDDHKGGKRKHRHQTGTSNTQMGDERQAQQIHDKKLLLKQTQRRKFKAAIAFYLVSSLVAAFYISMFFFTRSIFNQYQQGFYQYDAFFMRNTCQTESYFFLLKSILYNQSIGYNETGKYSSGQWMNQITSICTQNENKFRSIQQDNSGMFKGIVNLLQTFDSSDFCLALVSSAQSEQISADDDSSQGMFDLASCKNDSGGLLTQGLQRMIASSMNHQNQMRISYNAMLPSQRNVSFIIKTFFNKQTFQNIAIYYKYLEWTFRYVQRQANEVFSSQVETNFKSILAVFLVFMGCVLTLFFIVVHRLIKHLRVRLLKIRLTFKLIPSSEIFANKDHLEKLNTRML